MSGPATRTHQKARLTVSDVPRPAPAKIRPGSDGVRFDQIPAEKAAFLALVDEARIRAGLSVKEMAINAGNVPYGQFSEALSGTRGNFAVHWLDGQPAAFWLAWNAITNERYGLSPKAANDIYAEQIGQLVTLLLKRRGVA
jgi:hypothetical protein